MDLMMRGERVGERVEMESRQVMANGEAKKMGAG